MGARQPALLLVCLGNICRSPMAEGAMRAAAQREGLDIDIDSCGTAAYHLGASPDPRSIETAAQHGVDIASLQGRQLTRDDFNRFTHIFAMDHQNLANILAVQPAGSPAKVSLLMDMVPGREGDVIADPYYDGQVQFEITWADVNAAAKAIIKSLSSA